ncbi:MAG: hypothetical protein ATN35_02205 [Epulopiscium sp. Nele67-Bin004]|nr:MAG: hypothetical protein ATN35_02205 [Epulopiscium sp. Nele67-Bin004]
MLKILKLFHTPCVFKQKQEALKFDTCAKPVKLKISNQLTFPKPDQPREDLFLNATQCFLPQLSHFLLPKPSQAATVSQPIPCV